MVHQLVKEFLAFYRLNSILVLASHLRLGFPRGLCHSGLPTKIVYTLLSHTMSNASLISRSSLSFVEVNLLKLQTSADLTTINSGSLWLCVALMFR
jgi:hypothetical protein